MWACARIPAPYQIYTPQLAILFKNGQESIFLTLLNQNPPSSRPRRLTILIKGGQPFDHS